MSGLSILLPLICQATGGVLKLREASPRLMMIGSRFEQIDWLGAEMRASDHYALWLLRRKCACIPCGCAEKQSHGKGAMAFLTNAFYKPAMKYLGVCYGQGESISDQVRRYLPLRSLFLYSCLVSNML